jgi:hypothetical protein
VAGEHPVATDWPRAQALLNQYLDCGLTSFIDLTQEGEHGLPPYGNLLLETAARRALKARYRQLPIPDFGLPRTPATMRKILREIHRSLTAGERIYLHCFGGIGRTGTVVGCYLASQGHPGDRALEQLAARWQTVAKSAWHPHSPETDQQREYVRNWR